MKIEEFNEKAVSLRDTLLGIAVNDGCNHDDAEDTVQETLLRLWNMRDSLDTHPNIRALAITILHNIVRDRWRHQQHETALADGQRRDIDVSTEEARDDAELISLIVDRLPPLQKQIFCMKEVEGYTAEEIMDITGCTADSLRQNLSRARRKIREQFIKVQQLWTSKR